MITKKLINACNYAQEQSDSFEAGYKKKYEGEMPTAFRNHLICIYVDKYMGGHVDRKDVLDAIKALRRINNGENAEKVLNSY